MCNPESGMQKSTQWELNQQRINRIMIEYSSLKNTSQNIGRSHALRNEAANILYSNSFYEALVKKAKECSKESLSKDEKIFQTYLLPEDFIQEFVLELIGEYDHTKSNNFCAFLFKYLEYKIKNYIKQYNRGKYKKIAQDISYEEMSTVQDIDDVDGGNNSAYLAWKSGQYAELDGSDARNIDLYKDEKIFSQLVICVIRSQSHRGNDSQYYRCFVSGWYIELCKEEAYEKYEINENAAFSAMDYNFIDYTLSDKCRSFVKIYKTPLKKYGEIGISGESTPGDKEIELPFINRVYGTYLNVSDGAVSQHRNKFNADLRILERE